MLWLLPPDCAWGLPRLYPIPTQVTPWLPQLLCGIVAKVRAEIAPCPVGWAAPPSLAPQPPLLPRRYPARSQGRPSQGRPEPRLWAPGGLQVSWVDTWPRPPALGRRRCSAFGVGLHRPAIHLFHLCLTWGLAPGASHWLLSGLPTSGFSPPCSSTFPHLAIPQPQPSSPSSQTDPNGTVALLACGLLLYPQCSECSQAPRPGVESQVPACWQLCPGSLPLPAPSCAQFLECGRHSVNAFRPLHTLFPLPGTHFHLPVLSSPKLAFHLPPCALLELFTLWGSYLFQDTRGRESMPHPKGGASCPRLLALE